MPLLWYLPMIVFSAMLGLGAPPHARPASKDSQARNPRLIALCLLLPDLARRDLRPLIILRPRVRIGLAGLGKLRLISIAIHEIQASRRRGRAYTVLARTGQCGAPAVVERIFMAVLRFFRLAPGSVLASSAARLSVASLGANMAKELAEKVAVVTGASNGIARHCGSFAAAGAEDSAGRAARASPRRGGRGYQIRRRRGAPGHRPTSRRKTR